MSLLDDRLKSAKKKFRIEIVKLAIIVVVIMIAFLYFAFRYQQHWEDPANSLVRQIFGLGTLFVMYFCYLIIYGRARKAYEEAKKNIKPS